MDTRSAHANPAEPPAEEQTRLLAERYSMRAGVYDALWSPVIQPMAEPVLRALPLAGARRVLDLGTGSGGLLPRIRQLAPSASLLGVDRSPGMLRLASQKHPGPLAVMDAQALALRDHAFDVVILAFALFHVPEPRRALAEIKRLLRGDGLVAIVTWGPEILPEAHGVWDEELKSAGAVVQTLSATDQKASFDSAVKLATFLEEAGFVSVRTWSQSFEHRWSSEGHFEYCLGSNARLRLESLDEEARAACLKRIRKRLDGLDQSSYVYRPEVVFGIAAG
jgi:ubiquinone/menaquinone biosynthesis C-methylase UbiE